MTAATDPTPPVTLHIFDTETMESGSRRPYLSEFDGVFQDTPVYEEDIDIGCGLQIRCVLAGSHLCIFPMNGDGAKPWYYWAIPNEGDPLASIKVIGQAYTKEVTKTYSWWNPRTNNRDHWGMYIGYKRETVTQDDCYLPSRSKDTYDFNPHDLSRVPYLHLMVEIKAFGQTELKEMKFRMPDTGNVLIEKDPNTGNATLRVEIDVFGMKHTITNAFNEDGDYYGAGQGPVAVLYRHIQRSRIDQGLDGLWAAFLAQWMDPDPPMAGLASIYKRKAIKPVLERLEKESPLDYAFFRWLHSAQSNQGKKNNHLLGAMLGEIGADYDALLKALREARAEAPNKTSRWKEYASNNTLGQGFPARRAICLALPGAAEKVQAQAAAKDFRLHKSFGRQADGLGVTKKNYPKLRKAIEDGNISIKVFNQPGKGGQPVNREFPLWEKALNQKGWAEIIFEVCKNAARRGTYERDITPWLNALFQWPKFLDKHTPGRGKWKGFPKFVQTESELEMANEGNDNNGKQKTQKERSAFTPWVDNETRTLTIPYVAVCIDGVRTQWCYSKNFYLFEEGSTDPETGGIVLNDYESKLNGKDDYGLCYFTLTGTDIARGYPTFLIIFERRQPQPDPNCVCQTHTDPHPEAMGRIPTCSCNPKAKGPTWVHFHRVRPCRSKNGVKTPACELVERCYQYMAGNIPAEDITNQQGDLIFIKHGNDPLAAKAKVADDPKSGPVFEFESHRFVSGNPKVPLTLHISTAKTPRNRLGFMHAPSGFAVEHPEHDNIPLMEEGWYEIRRCRSWEANPVAVWSLTID